MCFRGDGLQQSPGTVPAAAGEQGGGPFIKPTGLGLSHGFSDQEFVLLVPITSSEYSGGLILNG